MKVTYDVYSIASSIDPYGNDETVLVGQYSFDSEEEALEKIEYLIDNYGGRYTYTIIKEYSKN